MNAPLHARPPLDELRARAKAGPPFDPAFLEALRADTRAGAQALYHACLRRLQHASSESAHADGMWRFEREALAQGFLRVAGVDEAGRGPLAGPIVAAAVVLAEPILGLDDSKRLTPAQREALFVALHRGGHHIGVHVVEAEQIDRYGIQAANYTAMFEAAAELDPPPDFLLVDGFAIPGCRFPQRALVKGDSRSQSIAAASIVAKVVRDRIMNELDRHYPEYGFAHHKGYGTAEHLAAIREHGPCAVHRKSFAPIAGHPESGLLFEEDNAGLSACGHWPTKKTRAIRGPAR